MIDVTFDFTKDTLHYWDDYWEDGLLGRSKHDPDKESKTLREYHRQLWSKELPCGQKLILRSDPVHYLSWQDLRLGSDSIIVSFRYKNNQDMIRQVADSIVDWQEYIEGYLKKSCTIGGYMVFPKMRNSINQARGCNRFIRDRWDLSMECIRKFYAEEKNPLFPILQRNKFWFDLFVDFKGFVDFFFLQDCVSSDCNKVNFWLGDGEFVSDPLPKSVDAYKKFLERELDFVEKRNDRIARSLR